MSIQTRQPAGIPTGGRFASTPHPEPATALACAEQPGLAERMRLELVDGHVVCADSQQIGYTINDVGELAQLCAAVALGTPASSDPEDRFVTAAEVAILKRVGSPSAAAQFWAGRDVYWTDDLTGVCAAVVAAVHAESARRYEPGMPHIHQA